MSSCDMAKEYTQSRKMDILMYDATWMDPESITCVKQANHRGQMLYDTVQMRCLEESASHRLARP